jgi:hypothetical protein
MSAAQTTSGRLCKSDLADARATMESKFWRAYHVARAAKLDILHSQFRYHLNPYYRIAPGGPGYPRALGASIFADPLRSGDDERSAKRLGRIATPSDGLEVAHGEKDHAGQFGLGGVRSF